jgi:peptidoglycan-associated lipoprotein
MSSLFRAATVSAVVLTTMSVGCARQPSVRSSVTASTVPPAAAAPTPAKGDTAVAVVVEEREIIAERQAPATFVENANVKPIYFDFDRYDIRSEDAKTLEADVAWLKSNDVLILVEGQCDERGTDDYNLALGDRRARATMSYLAALGIATNRISTVSYGKERPVCAEQSEACWALNRRAHIVVKPRG